MDIRQSGGAAFMERLTISVSDEFAAELAAFMESHNYDNRSEAVRDLARRGLERARIDDRISGECVATLSYVFNHHTRELARRLMDAHHEHHGHQVATMHVHLDHENCLEIVALRGDAAKVREFAKTIIAERGVTHGQVSFVPVSIDLAKHGHGGASLRHAHTHPKN
jgi:CopG family nickel-responsive transcriptional regulator